MSDSDEVATLFDSVQSKAKSSKPPAAKKSKAPATKKVKEKENDEEDGEDPLNVFETIEHATQGGKKRLSIERIYQKKSQLEHILLRPDSYIGTVEPNEGQSMWIFDSRLDRIVQREITYVPGLYKIFDEIVVNAADNKQRDKTMSMIKINIDQEKNEISVWNNGKGIPVVEHQTEKVFVPELIFGTLLTSSNYDDSQHKVTGGRNGFGAKLCNIFSTKFTVETSCKEYGKAFRQTWENNMSKTSKAKITECKGDDYTKIIFKPDLPKFKMEKLDDDIAGLMSRRAYDVAGSTRGVKVMLNSKRVPVVGFKQYVEQYVKDKLDDEGNPLKVVYEHVNERWEVAVTVSDKGFQQVSFVNSIATTKGGKHTDYIADQIAKLLIEHIKKKMGKSGINIKPHQIKNHLWMFVNCLIVNPTFDSQTKENMTLQAKSFGSKCELSDKFVQQCQKCGVVESVLSWVKFKQQAQLDQKCSGRKATKLKGVAKLEDANDAGTKNSISCTLILTEGDSAKTLAVSGLGVVGRDKYGVFPLRGKVLNVREATHKQIMENPEINNLIKIVGLQYKKKYDTDDDMKTLRYGKLMVMADQDQDGSHIKGLVVNFIHHNWPSLIRRNFVEEFITPIVKATKNKEEHSFFSVPEYLGWKERTPNWHTYRIKYYKGLGTSTAKEAKEYFSDMAKHRIRFKYRGEADDLAIELAFSKKKVEERKDWLSGWMRERKDRREAHLPEEYLYNEGTTHVSYDDFVRKELVLFSNMDNERSIPSLVDGLKPGQRKVLFTCFKRNDKREIKVAQLAGSVAEMSAYHHGEVSLMATIVNLAQNFVGSNNINDLLPIGQFGTRLQGGKDSASPRYIFTMLSPVARSIFPVNDDPVLHHLFDDNQKIEPEYYCPIIPMVLVNGAEGIGTGWSTKVPNFNPREIVENIRRLIKGEPIETMTPWYKNFKGTIEKLDSTRYQCSGEVFVVDDETIEITELPVKTWTQSYKENVLEPFLGSDKTPQIINDFKEYHTDTTVKFVVKLSPDKLRQLEGEGLHKAFKLQSTINTSSMVLFDSEGCLRKFERAEEIVEDFFGCRRRMYVKRKKYMEGLLQAQASRLSNQARFILEKIKGDIVMENKKKKFIVEKLIEREFDPDPLKKWKEEQRKKEEQEGEETVDQEVDEDGDGEQEDTVRTASGISLSDFDYLVTMSLIKLSEEEKDKLLKERDNKLTELRTLESKTWSDLWTEDLDNFEIELVKQEEKERLDELTDAQQSRKGAPAKGGRGGGGKKKLLAEVRPSPMGIRVVPRVDPALKERMEKADQAKENKGKRGPRAKKAAKGSEKKDDDDLENSSLFERLAKRSPDMKAKLKRLSGQQTMTKFLSTKAKGKKDEDDDDDDVQEIEAPKKAPKRKPAAKNQAGGGKKKKKDPWESDSDESEDEPSDASFSSDDGDDSGDDDDTLEDEEPKRPAPKANDKQAGPSKRQIVESDSDESVDDKVSKASADKVDDVVMVEEEEVEEPKPKKTAVKRKPAPKKETGKSKKKPWESDGESDPFEISDDSDDAADYAKNEPKPKRAATKKAKKIVDSDSDGSDYEPSF